MMKRTLQILTAILTLASASAATIIDDFSVDQNFSVQAGRASIIPGGPLSSAIVEKASAGLNSNNVVSGRRFFAIQGRAGANISSGVATISTPSPGAILSFGWNLVPNAALSGELNTTLTNAGLTVLWSTNWSSEAFLENERLTITSGQGSRDIGVTRGAAGTTAAAHVEGRTLYEIPASYRTLDHSVLSNAQSMPWAEGDLKTGTELLLGNSEVVNTSYNEALVATNSADWIETNALSIAVLSTNALPQSYPYFLRLEEEYLKVTSAADTNLVIERGFESTIATNHPPSRKIYLLSHNLTRARRGTVATNHAVGATVQRLTARTALAPFVGSNRVAFIVLSNTPVALVTREGGTPSAWDAANWPPVQIDRSLPGAFPALPYAALVDTEQMLVTNVVERVWTVNRGYSATATAEHSSPSWLGGVAPVLTEIRTTFGSISGSCPATMWISDTAGKESWATFTATGSTTITNRHADFSGFADTNALRTVTLELRPTNSVVISNIELN